MFRHISLNCKMYTISQRKLVSWEKVGFLLLLLLFFKFPHYRYQRLSSWTFIGLKSFWCQACQRCSVSYSLCSEVCHWNESRASGDQDQASTEQDLIISPSHRPMRTHTKAQTVTRLCIHTCTHLVMPHWAACHSEGPCMYVTVNKILKYIAYLIEIIYSAKGAQFVLTLCLLHTQTHTHICTTGENVDWYTCNHK